MTISELKLVTLYVDNKSMITLMKNPEFHGCSKHIHTRFYFIHECVEKRHIVVEFVCTRVHRVDILTKDLARVKFAEMRKLMGVKDLKQSQIYEEDCELINSTK